MVPAIWRHSCIRNSKKKGSHFYAYTMCKHALRIIEFVFISDPLMDYGQSTSHLSGTRMLIVRNKLNNKLVTNKLLSEGIKKLHLRSTQNKTAAANFLSDKS